MTDHRLYIDKYQSQSFADVKFNQDVAQQLSSLAQNDNLPHLIIKGYEGSGRKMLVRLFIKTKYHVEILHIKPQNIEIKISNKKIKLQMLYSDYHYQIDPSLNGVYDRIIIQSFIKDILQTKPIDKISYHIVVILNADRLTFEAQQSLRRTLEKTIGNSRFIFIINSNSSLIESLNSRCVQIRLASPTDEQIQTILESICQHENKPTDSKILNYIIKRSERNLTKAMNLLQHYHLLQSSTLNQSNLILLKKIDNIYQYVKELCYIILNAQDIHDIMEIRNRIYDLLVQCVDPLLVLKWIFKIIMSEFEQNKVSQQKKLQLIQIVNTVENNLHQCSKPIYHLENLSIEIILLNRNLGLVVN